MSVYNIRYIIFFTYPFLVCYWTHSDSSIEVNSVFISYFFFIPAGVPQHFVSILAGLLTSVFILLDLYNTSL